LAEDTHKLETSEEGEEEEEAEVVVMYQICP
jgi:hypothetical protein